MKEHMWDLGWTLQWIWDWVWKVLIFVPNLIDYLLTNYPWTYYVFFGALIGWIFNELKDAMWSYKENNKKEFSRNFSSATIGFVLLICLIFFN